MDWEIAVPAVAVLVSVITTALIVVAATVAREKSVAEVKEEFRKRKETAEKAIGNGAG
jgi:uncharacterized integral membrane protein